jgi:hypothetical protein
MGACNGFRPSFVNEMNPGENGSPGGSRESIRRVRAASASGSEFPWPKAALDSRKGDSLQMPAPGGRDRGTEDYVEETVDKKGAP